MPTRSTSRTRCSRSRSHSSSTRSPTMPTRSARARARRGEAGRNGSCEYQRRHLGEREHEDEVEEELEIARVAGELPHARSRRCWVEVMRFPGPGGSSAGRTMRGRRFARGRSSSMQGGLDAAERAGFELVTASTEPPSSRAGRGRQAMSDNPQGPAAPRSRRRDPGLPASAVRGLGNGRSTLREPGREVSAQADPVRAPSPRRRARGGRSPVERSALVPDCERVQHQPEQAAACRELAHLLVVECVDAR